jgi:hypothetical protein
MWTSTPILGSYVLSDGHMGSVTLITSQCDSVRVPLWALFQVPISARRHVRHNLPKLVPKSVLGGLSANRKNPSRRQSSQLAKNRHRIHDAFEPAARTQLATPPSFPALPELPLLVIIIKLWLRSGAAGII